MAAGACHCIGMARGDSMSKMAADLVCYGTPARLVGTTGLMGIATGVKASKAGSLPGTRLQVAVVGKTFFYYHFVQGRRSWAAGG